MEMFNIMAYLREDLLKTHRSKKIASKLVCVLLSNGMASSDKLLVELFIKAATTDKREKGPCLIGQQWFMTMYCLVEQGLIDLRFTPMTMELPPNNYERLNAARHLPIAWIESGKINGKDMSDQIISSTASLENLMTQLGVPNLNPAIDPEEMFHVEQIFENLYMNLMNYIRNDSLKPLLTTLTNLDDYLAQKAHPYLLGDQLTYVDCQLMPKLQHVRVAGRAYKDFEIPENLTYLWAYIERMYNTRAFTCSCPSDRDILIHYQDKDPLPRSVRLHLLGPDCLCEVPSKVQKCKPAVNGDPKNLTT